ncbi:amidohydrolase family protein [Virgibacillus sp. JSM 102003]|uniref:N-acyl-D-amino-acid deacylase family protein n=1 Tax=Virgibacillus sp. JSM 102003 TaxID=1562108 RepID=UPI0035C05E12
MFDVVIRNGMVCDGTGNPWTQLDIAVKDNKIINMSKNIKESARITIDASDKVVSPGFIDSHVHSDLLCTRSDIHKIKALQGVTTELFGQDGISVAPVSRTTKPHWQEQMKGVNGYIGDWPWETVDEYLTFLEQSNLIGNSVFLVPHGNIRTMVTGNEGRVAVKEECQKMARLVEEAMKQGACGVSTGIQYPPCSYANQEELIEICKRVTKYDGCFVVHIRNESNTSLEALDEVINVARESGVRLHVSHFKVCGAINRDKLAIALDKLDEARMEGIEVTFDQYPYTAASTILQAILPPWAQADGISAMLKRLEDKDMRMKIKHEILNSGEYDNPVRNNGWDNIIINSVASAKNSKWEGVSLAEIASVQGIDPSDAAFDLLIQEKASVTMIIHWGGEEDVMKVMKHPLQMVGSDGIFSSKPHPRLYGTYQRILGKYVREEEVFPIWEAIRKMTGAPAQLLRLKDRGLLRENYMADIVVFDPETITDKATYDEPFSDSTGIVHVLVNGELAVTEGKYTEKTPGVVIRKKYSNSF